MRVNHCRLYVLVSQKLLDRSYVIAAFQKVSGERVAEGMTGGALYQSGACYCIPHGFLDPGFIHVMAGAQRFAQLNHQSWLIGGN